MRDPLQSCHPFMVSPRYRFSKKVWLLSQEEPRESLPETNDRRCHSGRVIRQNVSACLLLVMFIIIAILLGCMLNDDALRSDKEASWSFRPAPTIVHKGSSGMGSSIQSHNGWYHHPVDKMSWNESIPKSSNRQPSAVLLVNFLFGEEASQKQYLRVFVESARYSGVNVTIIGNPSPLNSTLLLPDNVQHIRIQWRELAKLVKERVFQGKVKPFRLGKAKNRYKVIDLKPIIPILFPELVQDFDWWGHVDNDMVLGNLRQFLNEKMLSKYDIISGINKEYTWGPFTLYRNTDLINHLFQLASRPLEEIFARERIVFFDEWGGGSNRTEGKYYYNSTMAGIIDMNRKRLGIRWWGGLPVVWDGICKQNLGPCSECCLVRPTSVVIHRDGENGARQELVEKCLSGPTCTPQAIALCHFQLSKGVMDQSLVQKPDLVLENGFQLNFHTGVHV